MEKLIAELRPHLLQAGIPERQVTMPTADPEDIKIERYVQIFDWLSNFKTSDEFAAYLKVWRLRTPSQWQSYIDLDITGLQEQILLEKANAVLKRRWKRNRPCFFGRTFKPKGEGEEGSAEQDCAAEDSESE